MQHPRLPDTAGISISPHHQLSPVARKRKINAQTQTALRIMMQNLLRMAGGQAQSSDEGERFRCRSRNPAHRVIAAGDQLSTPNASQAQVIAAF